MSIQHFRDLDARQIVSILDSSWEISEKIDGSYFEFGFDNSGVFYTKRKGSPACHHISDWEMAAWTNGYRAAHSIAEQIARILRSNDLLDNGEPVGVEMLYEGQTNTIHYDISHVLAITVWNSPHREAAEKLLRSMTFESAQPHLWSEDGTTFQQEIQTHNWELVFVKSIDTHYLKNIVAPYSSYLAQWFLMSSGFYHYSNYELLNLKLTGKTVMPSADLVWGDFKKQAGKHREQTLVCFNQIKLRIERDVLYNFVNLLISEIDDKSWIEGIVVSASNGQVFKFVDKETFAAANRFVHRVKYVLVGGARPSRPCFVSRTCGQTPYRRVEMLDRIRLRYIANHSKRQHNVVQNGITHQTLSYRGDLHVKTLSLFADLRRRIIDGRYGF